MSQLYIRVRTGFYTHRKTMRLRAILGDDAFWIPPRLWAYAAENQPDGDLSGYSGTELAMLLACDKHATGLLQALRDSGFLNSEGKIHDWEAHNGYHKSFSDRARKAARLRWDAEKSLKAQKEEKDESGNRKGESGDKHCISNAPSTEKRVAHIPSLDEVKLQSDKIGLPPHEAEHFWNYFESNGWRVGRNPMRSWTHALANWKINWQKYGTKKVNLIPDHDKGF